MRSKSAPAGAIALLLLVPIAAIAADPVAPNIHSNRAPQPSKKGERVSIQPRYTPPPFPTSGTPTGRTRGAAGRGGCGLNSPLTALAPAREKSLETGKATYVWGKTTAEHPTFWFYVPTASSLRAVEFVLQDERDNDVYRSAVSLPARSGIIGVRLPSSIPPLNLNQNYHWFLKTEMAVSCDRQNSTLVKDSVEGWIVRVSPEPTISQQLASATPQQRISLYAQAGLWYDALTTLAEQRLQKPEDTTLKASWDGLLQSANLSDVTSQPLLPCCVPN